MNTKTQIKKSKKLGTVPKKLTPKMSHFVKMFDDILTGKMSNGKLSEQVSDIILKNSNDVFLLDVAKHFYLDSGYNSQAEKLKTLRRTINRESKKLFNDDKIKNAISFKLVKGENFKENKNDFSFSYSSLEVKESVVNLNKLIQKIRDNKLDLTDENKKELYELSKGL
tara:strand:+ start:19 stop:522 length:504 start_codon:yes stop_codon:yes gene_type:complete